MPKYTGLRKTDGSEIPAGEPYEVNRRRQFALTRHCRLSVETMHPDFSRRLASGLTVVLTVNSGYE